MGNHKEHGQTDRFGRVRILTFLVQIRIKGNTAEVLRRAPNFDNNQAFLGNPGNRYSPAMLKLYWRTADAEDRENLMELLAACKDNKYLADAYQAGMEILNS